MMYIRQSMGVGTNMVDLFVLVAFLIAIPLIVSTLRTYYMLDDSELLINLGRRRQYRISYTKIRGARKIDGPHQASVPAKGIPRDSVEVAFEDADGLERFVFLSPKDRDVFVRDLEMRVDKARS